LSGLFSPCSIVRLMCACRAAPQSTRMSAPTCARMATGMKGRGGRKGSGGEYSREERRTEGEGRRVLTGGEADGRGGEGWRGGYSGAAVPLRCAPTALPTW
jgi:hypothetical protein